MSKDEIIEYLYEHNVRGDLTIEQMAEDLADRKTEPQTYCDNCMYLHCNYECAGEIVHKMIDDAVIAEDVYPDLRQRMHDAVDEYEPQTDNGIGCSRCEGRFDCYDRDMPYAVRCNNYGKITDEPQTERSDE